jgi:hypothetical protein
VVPEELAVRVVIKQATAEMHKRICWFCRQGILVGSDLDGGMIRGWHAMRLGDDDAVAAGGFATIKSLVCASHDGAEARIRADKLSDPCGKGYLDVSGG